VQDKAILDSIIRVNRQGASMSAGGHPAPYPVGLPSSFIRSWPGLVYDPFLGSGTTLIASEQLSRICYGMEISPGYVGVILQRAADAGMEPRLESRKAKPKRKATRGHFSKAR
jgi:DNA modification methylase